jgi:hypothetical protein
MRPPEEGNPLVQADIKEIRRIAVTNGAKGETPSSGLLAGWI